MSASPHLGGSWSSCSVLGWGVLAARENKTKLDFAFVFTVFMSRRFIDIWQFHKSWISSIFCQNVLLYLHPLLIPDWFVSSLLPSFYFTLSDFHSRHQDNCFWASLNVTTGWRWQTETRLSCFLWDPVSSPSPHWTPPPPQHTHTHTHTHTG